jgi:hypothetical protein
LADDIECAKQWLLPQRPVTQVEVNACIGELDIIVSQLRAGAADVIRNKPLEIKQLLGN